MNFFLRFISELTKKPHKPISLIIIAITINTFKSTKHKKKNTIQKCMLLLLRRQTTHITNNNIIKKKLKIKNNHDNINNDV